MTPYEPPPPDRRDSSYDDAIGIVSARRRKRRSANRKKQNRGFAVSALVVIALAFVAVLAGGTAGAGLAAYSVVDGLNLKDLPKKLF